MKFRTMPRTFAAAVAAFAATAATPGIAHAESSITLYGDIDAGVTYTNNQQVTHADGSVGGGHNFQFSGGNLHQVNLGATFNLSKRTTLYAVGIFQKAAGSGIGIDPVTGQAKNYAQIPNLPNPASDKQLSPTKGIKHTF